MERVGRFLSDNRSQIGSRSVIPERAYTCKKIAEDLAPTTAASQIIIFPRLLLLTVFCRTDLIDPWSKCGLITSEGYA